MPYREVFGFSMYGRWVYEPTVLAQNPSPIGYRHIKLYPNAPKFEFLSGWFAIPYNVSVLGIFYLNYYGKPQLYFPLHGNGRNVSNGGNAYSVNDTYPKDAKGFYAYSYDNMRNDIINRFDLDREEWR